MTAPVRPIAVSVVTGFLGSGKTTLINALLRDPALTNTAVIVNEFGAVGVDHLLVEQSGDGVIELSDGCLCCTVRGDLIDTLAGLLDRVADGRIAALDRIVIETTGLADPAPVLAAVTGHPTLQDRLRLEAVITTIDAVNGDATLDRHAEARRQAAVADRIVLTKTDLAEPAQTAAIAARLAALNPAAGIIEGGAPAGASAALLDSGPWNAATKPAAVAEWLQAEAAKDAHEHHHHDVNRHDDAIRCFALTHDTPVEPRAVETFLELMASAHGDKLLRMKGIVDVAGAEPGPLVIHAAQRVVHPPHRLPVWPDGQRGTRIVVIVQDLPETFVRRLFDAVLNRPAIDTPDRAALQDNPLAIPGT